MNNAVLARQDDGTIQLTITIPEDKIKKAREDVLTEYTDNVTLPGFRKGKAPKKMVEESLDKTKLKEEMLKRLLPNAYLEAVQEHKLQPIINPQIHVEKLDDGADWVFKATTCELPEVKLDDYKKAISAITAKSKIAIPGKEPEAPKFDDIMKALVDSAEVKIPQVLVDQEVERLLAQLLDEIKRLGLNLDQYIASTGKNPEQLRTEYAGKARNDIKLEFTLQKVAEDAQIQVEEKELEEAIQKATTDDERKNLEQNRYLLANILRQQKTLDYLKNL